MLLKSVFTTFFLFFVAPFLHRIKLSKEQVMGAQLHSLKQCLKTQIFHRAHSTTENETPTLFSSDAVIIPDSKSSIFGEHFYHIQNGERAIKMISKVPHTCDGLLFVESCPL
jgi:hypothetical protein